MPTIKAEGGGGEVATNVFIKGLPSGGQYQFTPLEYDGIPVFSSFGLNSSAFDVYYRNDLGIERLEFVRGGVSNLFGPGSVAGLINYISKTGTRHARSRKCSSSSRTRIARAATSAMSGPLGADSNLYYALSGFYRYDEGPIKTGNDTEGFQLRGNLKREFEDGSGSITLYGQYIDDQVQFYLPFPLDGASRNRIRGNDGDTVYSVQTSQVDGMGFITPDGQFRSSIGDGVVTKDGSLAIVFDKDLGDGWGVNAKAKYASYDHSLRLLPRRRRRGQRAGDAGSVSSPTGTPTAACRRARRSRTRRSPTRIRVKCCRPTRCCSRIASSIATARRTT